ncbi:MAG TPA: DUF4346 domain-containing protein, partial [Acidilobales archaeon]|nr:DUF4346 domain-containing protein [Acidilobales archaeon]
LMLKDLMNKIDTPILFGLANVYELMDADTHGVIALLTALALECGTSLLLVTEESRKSQGALCELHKAINMVYRSVLRRSPLLNTGIDLLIVKEKRDMKISRPRFKELIKVKVKKSPIEFEPSNYFKILVDDLIYALNFRNNEEVARRAYVGTDGLSIGREIISRGDVKSLDHALYLGYELAKAEIALQLGKNYVQDSKLFRLGECYGR